jgi:hypothetical protein
MSKQEEQKHSRAKGIIVVHARSVQWPHCYSGAGGGLAAVPSPRVAAAARVRWHSATIAAISTGFCSKNACMVGSNTRSGRRARTDEYKGHTNRACCTSSSPPWQWGQVHCAQGTRSHLPVPLSASATHCAAGLGPPCESAAAQPPSMLPARAHTPPPLAAARPKLQLGSVRAWRRLAWAQCEDRAHSKHHPHAQFAWLTGSLAHPERAGENQPPPRLPARGCGAC